ncbi:MAG: RNA polymerase sigma factor, partial [Gemmataceae bacterium]|nr:RNA polymerase sigma factor [Gemmataceae bacterium]
MSKNQPQSLLQYLRHAVARAGAGDVEDAELLERFVGRADPAAFELLLWRHGPMVLGVCWRLLGQEQDAEDAFQAAFLALVRKARSIGKREAVASWLFKVAYRIACRARTLRSKASSTPTLLVPNAQASDAEELANDLLWRDLRPVLDQEIDRLPESYRRLVVLCYLQGKTNDEAARLLGCPRGTVATRLARAREKLRRRLVR